jgi:regulator of replication initiation timing
VQFLIDSETSESIRQTVKSLVEERDTLKHRLEKCSAALHLLRIENDQLRKEAQRAAAKAK